MDSDSFKPAVAIVGAGRQTLRKAIPALREAGIQVHSIVDPDELLKLPSTVNPKGLRYSSVQELLSSGHSAPPAAYVALPHNFHRSVVLDLLKAGVKVIKEKPLAINFSDAREIVKLAKDTGVKLAVATQRDFSRKIQAFRDMLHLVGTVHAIHATESIVEPNLDQGWRAALAAAGGGVVIDLGYHMLHQLVRLFGAPTTLVHAALLRTRKHQKYDVEDTAHLQLTFPTGIEANVILSRADSSRVESLKVIGEKGVLHLQDSTITFTKIDRVAEPPQSIHANEDTVTMLSRCLGKFISDNDDWVEDLDVHLQVMELIDTIYTRFRTPSHVFHPDKQIWKWPRITNDVVQTVVDQAHRTVSIYDNSGVLGEFETRFKEFHAAPDSYALLHNSGTNALFALYYSAGIGKNDEVVVPVYTFHATVTPLMQLGAVPVFVDASPDTGNIDPKAVESVITSRTKAVVVTHMWGIPCKMNEIAAICKAHNVLLLEDCSHAHGARIGNQYVGTFGDGAAWSLQGEKVLTGGEGGITLTKHQDMHIKMLLIGHFNKRCKVEIPGDHPLRKFALTGVGLKNRSHPLAVAIALNQLDKLPGFLEVKTRHAKYLKEAIADIPFLEGQGLDGPDAQVEEHPSWYVFVVRFDKTKAPCGLSRDKYVRALQDRGLKDVDIPGSTKPLNEEPLYRMPWEVLSHLYSQDEYKIERTKLNGEFPGADEFYRSTFKIPVWALPEERNVVEHYAKTMKDVAKIAMDGGFGF